MVNATEEHDSHEIPVTVDLGALKGDPLAEQLAAAFITSLKGAGTQRMLNLVSPTNGNSVSNTDARSPFRHGCSPSDWVHDEAQMTKGGTGEGGYWVTD